MCECVCVCVCDIMIYELGMTNIIALWSSSHTYTRTHTPEL